MRPRSFVWAVLKDIWNMTPFPSLIDLASCKINRPQYAHDSEGAVECPSPGTALRQ